jgi:signal transduction histidine kinase
LPWLARANRLATVAQLLESTVHEANNALQVLGGHAELLASMPAATEAVRQRADAIGEKVRTTSLMLQELLTFSRGSTGPPERFTLAEVVDTAVRFRRHSLNRLRVAVTIEPAVDHLTMIGGQLAVLQVVLNLILNAEQALEGRPSGSLRLQTRRHGDTAELIVEDNGPGLAAEAGGVGTELLSGTNQLGIGLRVAGWLAEQQGGRLRWARPEQGSGCRVTVSWPCDP